jgi:sugar lactone lactonase YvrE
VKNKSQQKFYMPQLFVLQMKGYTFHAIPSATTTSIGEVMHSAKLNAWVLRAMWLFAVLLTSCGGGGASTSTSNHLMGGAVQGIPLNLAPNVSTFAGTASKFVDDTGAAARFQYPTASVVVSGNLYVADTFNHAIRKIVIATGEVTTLAGSTAGLSGATDDMGTAARFNFPCGITTDGTNLYVADRNNHAIRKIVIATGGVTTLAGSTTGLSGAADDTGTAARFNFPSDITTYGTNLYVADSNNRKIRVIEIATGVVSSLTGTANTAASLGAMDGVGAIATFKFPSGITTDGTNLYVADRDNNKIRQIVISSGLVSSLTGTASTAASLGAMDGTGATATFYSPSGITTDGTNLYIADSRNNKIRKVVIATGVVSSMTGVADTPSVTSVIDGAGSIATFDNPTGITTDGTNLYVADSDNNKIRKIVIASGIASSLAGTHPGTDATGIAATFGYPASITTDGTNLYVADSGTCTIRKIVFATGVVTTIAGQVGVCGAVDGTGPTATFNAPVGITTDGSNLYVADRDNNKIRKIVIASGVVSSLTGKANTAGSNGAADGAGATATFNQPFGITTDGTNLYVADSANNKIRKIVIATGVVSSLTGTANTASSNGAADGAGATATFNQPPGITTDGTKLYVADSNNNKIRKIVIATGVVSSFTGTTNTAMTFGAIDGTGATSTFYSPQGITTDGTNLYVADSNNNKIRKIVIATGVVSSLTGTSSTAGTLGATDGTGTAATFTYPQGITSDGTNLYVTDTSNSTIRKIQ